MQSGYQRVRSPTRPSPLEVGARGAHAQLAGNSARAQWKKFSTGGVARVPSGRR
jgi:hypothetical protein